MTSIHDACGEQIVWARREEDTDRFLPPLEFAGSFFVVDGNSWDNRVGHETIVYKVHHCDPEKIVAWEDYKERLAEAKGIPYSPAMNYEAAKERDREQLWNKVLKVACPRCEVNKKQKCISLALKHIKTGEIVELKNPHPARVEAFEVWHRKD